MKEFHPFQLDVANECLWRSGERIPLTPKAFSLLAYLVDHPGELVTQSELIEKLWPDTFVQPEVLKTHIRDLRSALGDDARKPTFIETQHRRGYRFIASVHERNGASNGVLRVTLPVPDPPPPASPDRSTVGLDADLASLLRLFQQASAGATKLVFVTGEVGVGKTTLINALEQALLTRSPEITIIRGQCVEGYGSREPYYPVLEAVAKLFRTPARDAAVQALARYAPTWLEQFPALLGTEQRDSLMRDTAGATTERMLREFCDVIEVLADAHPILILLEDMHWADPYTVDWLAALARRRTRAKLMVVSSYRPVQLFLSNHPLKELKRRLLAHSLCTEIAIEPLDAAQVAALIESKAPQQHVPPGLPDLLYQYSEGNPLFIEAAIEHLLAHSVLVLEQGRWTIRKPLEEIRSLVPETLRQLLEAHIDSELSPAECAVLEAASVCGTVFPSFLAAAACEQSLDDTEQICEPLAHRGHFIKCLGAIELPDGSIASQYTFVHSLYREIFYQRIAPARRARLHRRIADKLESVYAGKLEEVSSQLAYHLERCSAWARVPQFLLRAARIEVQRFAYRDAIRILQHGLDLLDRLTEPEAQTVHIQLLYDLSSIHSLADNFPAAIQALESTLTLAAQLGDVRVQVQAWLRMAFLLCRMSAKQCVAAAEQALHLSLQLSDPSIQAEARMSARFWNVTCTHWNDEYAAECRALGADLSNGHGPLQPLGGIILPTLDFLSTRYVSGLQALEASRSFLRRSGDRAYRGAQLIEIWLLLFAGRLGEALSRCHKFIAYAVDDSNRIRENILKVSEAWIHAEALDAPGVLALCSSSNQALNTPESVWARNHSSVLEATAEIALGNLAAAQSHLQVAKAMTEAQDTWLHWYFALPILKNETELALRLGDLPAARHHAQHFLESALHTPEHTWQARAWESLARVHLAMAETDNATLYIQNALRLVENHDLPLAAWRVHRTAARILTAESAEHDHHAATAIQRIADSLQEHPELRDTFLAAAEIQPALHSS